MSDHRQTAQGGSVACSNSTCQPRPTRRGVLRVGVAGAAAAAFPWSRLALAGGEEQPLFKISLAEWSLHRALFRGQLDHLDFAREARERYGLHAVEYVSQFFRDKARDAPYLKKMKQRCADHGVRSLLIMVDGEGALGAADAKERRRAVENHYKWVAAAKYLGCHSIRVNAAGTGSYDELMKQAADGLRQLTEFATRSQLNVLVENHGGLSSNGAWLAAVIRKVDHPRCGTLPDFGNFHIGGDEWYDRYKGVAEMMPFAKAVSAKSYEFDEQGNEKRTDYRRMLKIVLAAGYHGHLGIEYEGDQLSEPEGILATKRLLERIRDELSTGN